MLGRPVQALEQLAALLAQHVEAQMKQSGHRPVVIRIQDAQFTPLRGSPPAQPQAFLERITVQAHMAARYGFTEDSTATGNLEAVSASSTELRIAAALHSAICQAVTQTVAHAQSAMRDASWTTSTSGWQWQALIQVADSTWQPLRIELDPTSSQALERYALQMRSSQQPATGARSTPEATLQVGLSAQLLEKTVSAATVHALRTGSVLPIALGRSTVLLNGTALLTATLAEHHGKLHLTAFETLE